jgi:hypothetical protein
MAAGGDIEGGTSTDEATNKNKDEGTKQREGTHTHR